jgi:hypothetical protein
MNVWLESRANSAAASSASAMEYCEATEYGEATDLETEMR